MQACVTSDEPEEAFSQLQVPLSEAFPGVVPPLLQPLVVAGPFGSNKRAVLQKLVAMLPDVLAVPKVVTSKPHLPGQGAGEPRRSLSTRPRSTIVSVCACGCVCAWRIANALGAL